MATVHFESNGSRTQPVPHATAISPGTSADTVNETVEHKQDENDHDTNYKAAQTSPTITSQYSEFDSDDDEIAFGTTVDDDNYMTRFKQHNRTQSKITAGVLLSPHHAHISADQADKIIPNISIFSDQTANAMQQSAKYYNDLNNVRRGGGRHSTQYSSRLNNESTISSATENFESGTLEYGQSVLFDKMNEQYFSDLNHNEKRYILINLHVNRITEIDNVQERFRCKFWISFSWLPTYDEYIIYKKHLVNNTLDEWIPTWIPIITFPELIRTWKLQFAERPNTGKFSITFLHGKSDELGYDPTYCKFIRCKLECDMTFSTGFLLNNFPVDCQDLPISIHETSGGCVFVAEKRKRSFASVHTVSSVMEEWEFINMIVEMGVLHTGSNESNLAQLKLRLKMRRRYEVYLWNVVFFMMCISGLTLCSFAVSDIDLGERLGIIITLLLTSVAYQSTVFSTLPNVPYLTLLDKYIVVSFLFMTVVTIETAMLGTNYLDDDEHNIYLFIATMLLFIGYHIVFVIYGYNRKNYESSKLYMPSKTMMALTSMSRERMEVEWKSEKKIGSNWKVYTKYPDKIITKTKNGKDSYHPPKLASKRSSIF